jgi:hypothetical protein
MAKIVAFVKKLHFLFHQQRAGIRCGGNDLSRFRFANFSEALGFLSLILQKSGLPAAGSIKLKG